MGIFHEVDYLYPLNPIKSHSTWPFFTGKSTFRKVRSFDLRRSELLRPLRPRPARRGRGRGRGDLERRATAPGGILNVPQGSGVLDKSWTNDCYIYDYIYMAYIYGNVDGNI